MSSQEYAVVWLNCVAPYSGVFTQQRSLCQSGCSGQFCRVAKHVKCIAQPQD